MAEEKIKQRLLLAIRKGDHDKVGKILEAHSGQISPNAEADTAQNRLLHRAARYGHVKVVERLLTEKGCDANATNKFGMVPLHHAAVNGDPNVIEALVKGGAKPYTQDDGGRVPLHWATAHGHVEAVKVLLESGAGFNEMANVKDKEGWTPLHRNCQQPPPKEKSNSQSKNESDATKENNSGKGQETELLNIEEEDKKRTVMAELLLTLGGVDPDTTDSKGQHTALHLCAMNGYANVAKLLLRKSKKIQVDPVNKLTRTPLMYACVEDHVSVVKVLLEYRANPLAKDMLHNEWNCLHFAIMQDNVETVKALIENSKKVGKLDELIKVRDSVGRLPMVVAEDHTKHKVAGYLKENGYDDVSLVIGPRSFEHKESFYIHGEGPEKTTSITKKN